MTLRAVAAGAGGGGGTPGGSSGDVQYNNAGAFGGITLTDGQLLIGSTGSAPSAASLTAGSNITITPGAGTITIASSASPVSGILFADAPNSDFDLTNGGGGGNVTIISKSITGIAAGDQIQLDIWYTILNNSSASRTYTQTGDLGSLSVTSAETSTVAANATSRSVRHAVFNYTVSATNLAYGTYQALGSAVTAANTGIINNNPPGLNIWNSTTNDLTGAQTLDWKVSSNSTTTTQTLTLHSYTITKIPTT